MRILHTSDWHLGASFDTVSRDDDHRRFFDWLLAEVEAQAVDVLIVAGDVFDHANPSAESQRLYYELLRSLARTRLSRTVVVAGNHDSASRLEAPRELLEALAITVVGSVSVDEDALDRALVPIRGASGEVALVVAAVPYVHEYRLGLRLVGRDESQILAEFREQFRALYTALVDRAAVAYPGAPSVATGHMACVGSTTDDAPAEIHLVGSLGGLPADVFDPRLAYVALGHVHRAYRVSDAPLAYYSGTPLAFSRKESKAPRSVRLVDVDASGVTETRVLVVPTIRRVVEVEGSVDEVCASVASLEVPADELPPIVCATIRANAYDADAERRVREAATNRPLALADIRTVRARAEASTDDAEPSKSLAELRPIDVFRRLCAKEGEELDDRLLAAFVETLSRATEAEP